MKWLTRIVIGILIIILVGFFGLWIAGQRSDRGHFAASIMIDRPINEVYNALIDPEMTKKWVSGIAEIKRLTPGNTHVGTKLLLIEDVSGHRVSMEEEITDLQPPRLVKYTTQSQGNPLHSFTELGEYQLEEKDGKTQFTLDSHITYHGFLYSLFEPLITPSVKSKFAGDQMTLKKILEQGK